MLLLLEIFYFNFPNIQGYFLSSIEFLKALFTRSFAYKDYYCNVSETTFVISDRCDCYRCRIPMCNSIFLCTSING